jgi:uncharacterized membrane protein
LFSFARVFDSIIIDSMKNANKKQGWTIQKALPYILIVTGIIALVASFVLMLDHINILKDPNYQPSCSLNPILSCGPVMKSDQAQVFGFPNPLIGLVVFGAQIMLGVALLAGAKLKNWFWWLFGLNLLADIGFTIWLIDSSIFEIKAICIYCMTTWVMVFISSWYTFQFMLAEGIINIKNQKIKEFLRIHHLDILIGIFVIVALLILHEFWYYYEQFFKF